MPTPNPLAPKLVWFLTALSGVILVAGVALWGPRDRGSDVEDVAEPPPHRTTAPVAPEHAPTPDPVEEVRPLYPPETFAALEKRFEGTVNGVLTGNRVQERWAHREWKLAGAEGIPYLRAQVRKDQHPKVRALLLFVLADLRATDAIPEMKGAFLDATEDIVRTNALYALSKVGGPAERTFLEEALRTAPNDFVAGEARKAIERIEARRKQED